MTPPSPSGFPTPRCVAAPEPRACCESHYLPPRTPPAPSNPGSSAIHCCSARLASLAACPAPRDKLPVQSVPTPWSAASPCSQGLRSCQAGRAESARSAGVPLLPLCARASRAGAEGEGGGRCLSVSPAFARAARSAAAEAGSPESRCGEPLGALLPVARREWARGGEGGDGESGGPILPPGHLGLTAPLPPRRPPARPPARSGAERAQAPRGTASTNK